MTDHENRPQRLSAFLGYVPTEMDIIRLLRAGRLNQHVYARKAMCAIYALCERVFSEILSGICETVEKCYENRFRSYFIIDKNERLCYISVCLVVKEKPWILIMRIF